MADFLLHVFLTTFYTSLVYLLANGCLSRPPNVPPSHFFGLPGPWRKICGQDTFTHVHTVLVQQFSQIGSSPQVGVRKHMIFTRSPIIMVQWKTAIFKKYLRGNCCSRYIHFSLNHDYGRIREKPSFIFHRIHGTIVYLPTFLYGTDIWTYTLTIKKSTISCIGKYTVRPMDPSMGFRGSSVALVSRSSNFVPISNKCCCKRSAVGSRATPGEFRRWIFGWVEQQGEGASRSYCTATNWHGKTCSCWNIPSNKRMLWLRLENLICSEIGDISSFMVVFFSMVMLVFGGVHLQDKCCYVQ